MSHPIDDTTAPILTSPVNLAQTTFGVGFIALLSGAVLWIMAPFGMALIWASTIVISTWPVLLLLQRQLGGRRGLAATAMTLVLLLVFALPLVRAFTAIATQLPVVAGWLNSPDSFVIPAPPEWLAGLPVVGTRAAETWNIVAHEGVSVLKPYAGDALRWSASQLGGIGRTLVHILLTVIIAGILYTQGDAAATEVRRFARRLAGERGDRAVVLAGQTIRGVAQGVVITALAQSLVAGTGLAVAGVPFAGPLTAVVFLFCIAQIGPFLVLAPAVIWMYSTGDATWATVLLVFTIVAGTMDNFVRPILIRKGADLPLLLIFAGVIGGLVSLGLVGIFIGPVVLAVAYRMFEEWVSDAPASA